MNSRFEVITFSGIVVLMILGLAGSSSGRSMSTVPAFDAASTVTADATTIGNATSVVVPQVGFLEERADVVKAEKDKALPNGDSGNGILVPIVSFVDAHDSSPKSASPLVALLPAPAPIGKSTDPAKLPVITTLPILPVYDQVQPAVQPEIRRFLRDASSDKAASPSKLRNGDTYEIMDVAEDIVFRPLFRIRPSAGRYPAYSTANLQRRKNGYNYRRYNVNGYYRLPYDYFRNNNNNNNNNNRDDYGNDHSSDEYYDRRRSS